MGCTSSTEYVVDPATGQEIQKKRLGGNYPGNRRPTHAPYTPPAADFDGKTGQATAHFISYGGGNALTLVQKDGSSSPETGSNRPEYIEVTVPDGVKAGQTIHVQAPDGRLNEVIIPDGFGPGDVFTVEFAPALPEAAATATGTTNSTNFHTPLTHNNNSNNNNGGGNSSPPTTRTSSNSDNFAAALDGNNDNSHNNHNSTTNHHQDYPSAYATPVYSPPPQYPTAQTL